MRVELVRGEKVAIVAETEDIYKGIFRPKLVANYTLFDPANFRPVGGGQQAHPQYREFFKENIALAEEAFNAEVADFKKMTASKSEVVYHYEYSNLLAALKAGYYPYLVGPAGTGKSFTCEQLAHDLNLDFYSQNCVTDASDLTGYTDAVGNYVQKAFYKAFKDGGLFLFDEIDSSVPEALMCINNALANGFMLFPNGEQVKANTNFKIVLAGNTFGTGATSQYNTRCKLDEAFRDRIAIVRYGYDKQVEKRLAKGDEKLLAFYYAYRNTLKQLAITQIASYRGLKNLANHGDLSLCKAIEYGLTKELSADTIKQIYEAIPIDKDDRYMIALLECYNNVKKYEEVSM